MSAVLRVVSVVLLLEIVSLVSAQLQTVCDDIELSDEADASQYANCETARNIYAYGANQLTSVSLPRLTSVGHLYLAYNTFLTLVSFPLLTVATGGQEGDALSILNNDALQTIDLGALRTTPSLSISENDALTTVALQSLTGVDGHFSFSGNTALQSVDLRSLERCYNFEYKDAGTILSCQPWIAGRNARCPDTACGTIDLNYARDAAQFAYCETAEGIYVTVNPMLTSILLPRLTAVTGVVSVYSNVHLTVVSLPHLNATGHHFEDALLFVMNKALTFIDLAALPTTNRLRIMNNTALVSVDLSSLASCDEFIFEGAGTIISCQPWLMAKKAKCPKVCGTIDLSNEADASKYVVCETADGIYASGKHNILTSVVLKHLTSVGFIQLEDNPALTMVSLPRLTLATSTRGITIRASGALQGIDLSALRTTANLIIDGNGALSSLALDALTRVYSHLNLASCQVPVISAPNLTSIGAVSIERNGGMVALYMPTLKTVDSVFSLLCNDALQSLSLPSLQTIGSLVSINDNAMLQAIAMPVLTTVVNGVLMIYNHPSLMAVALPQLVSINPLQTILFGNNSVLEAVDLRRLAHTGTFDFRDAATIISCQPWLMAQNAICPQVCDAINLDKDDPLVYADCGSASSVIAKSSSKSLTEVRLVALTSVSGAIILADTWLETVSLPLLATVGSLHIMRNDHMKQYNVPSVYSASTVSIAANSAAPLSMPTLVTVSLSVEIMVTSFVSLPNLRTVGTLNILSCAAMTAPVEFPSLQRTTLAGGEFCVSTTGTSRISAPWLTSIAGTLIVKGNNKPYVNLLRLQTLDHVIVSDCSYILSCQRRLVESWGAHCPQEQMTAPSSVPPVRVSP